MAVVILIILMFCICLGPVTFAEEADCYNRYNKGVNYAGNISETTSGRSCLKWNEVNIHPFLNYREDHNYCRNPLPSQVDSPWCYTTKAWAYEKCTIPVCDCRNSTNDFGYNGNIRITRRGHNCRNNDYCRAPSGHKDGVGGPWCFTGLGNPRWDYCNVPVCESAQCPELSGNPNLKPLDGKKIYRYGEIVMLTCNSGYRLNGSRSLTCQKLGLWNDTIPNCQEKSQSQKDSMENRGKCISYGLFGGILAATVFISAAIHIATCFYYRKRVRKSAAVYEDMQFNAVERQGSSNEETYSELT